MSKTSIQPLPGWVITKPYINPKSTFVSAKETQGDAQRSVVLAVGDNYEDEYGNVKVSHVKVGDIILHFYAQHTFEKDFDQYRAVHFNNIIGIVK